MITDRAYCVWHKLFGSSGNPTIQQQQQQQKRPAEQPSKEVIQNHTSIIECPTSMALLFILSFETIVVCIMESFVLYYHSKIFSYCEFSLTSVGLGQADFIYHGLYIATPIYQLCMYLDVLRQRNIVQLFALILFGALAVIFSGIQTMQHMIFEQAGCDPWHHNNSDYQNGNSTTTTTTTTTLPLKMSVIISNTTRPGPNYQDIMESNLSNIRPFEYSLLAVIILVFFILLGCTFKLYKLFRWNNHLFHTFADIRLRNTLISWAIFTGLLRIDFFFTFAYAVQLVPTGFIGYSSIPTFESGLVFAVGLVGFLLALHAIRNEDMKTLHVFNGLVFGSIGYFGYRLYTFGVSRDPVTDPFLLTRYNLLFTTLTVTLLMILTLCIGLVCVRNVMVNKVRILQDFKCICPTCYFHSSSVMSEDNTPATCSLKTASLDLHHLPAQQGHS